MQNQMIGKKEYLQVIETGSLEPAFEHEEAEMHLIKEENEALYRGEPVKALWSDNHQQHIAEHLSLLSNLDARRNDKIVNAVREHVRSNISLMPPPPPLPPAGPGGPQAPTPPPAQKGPGQPGVSSQNAAAQTSVTAPKPPSGSYVIDLRTVDRAALQLVISGASLGTSTVTLKASLDNTNFIGFATAKTLAVSGATNGWFDLGSINYPYLQVSWTAPQVLEL
jgi:hypothetical protein